MKRLLILSASLIGLVAETNLVSFTTLDGKGYEQVRIVSTNKEGIMIKVTGQAGWELVKMTNLNIGFQVMLESTEQPIPEAVALRRLERFIETNEFLVQIDAEIKKLAKVVGGDELNQIRELEKKCRDRRLELELRKIDLESKWWLAQFESGTDYERLRKTKELEQAQNRDDYYKGRISEVDQKRREIALDQKWAAIYARHNATDQAVVARKREPLASALAWNQIEISEIALREEELSRMLGSKFTHLPNSKQRVKEE